MEDRYKNFENKKTSAYELLEYLRENGFEDNPPIDVEEIVRYLNVDYANTPDFRKFKVVGSISLIDGKPKIWVNPMENSMLERKRFTIAHELGHLMFNHLSSIKQNIDDDIISLNRDDNWDELEMEANGFAAQLLMPANIVKEEREKYIADYRRETHQTPSNDVRKILDGKLGTRNSAAHPSGIVIGEHKAVEFGTD